MNPMPRGPVSHLRLVPYTISAPVTVGDVADGLRHVDDHRHARRVRDLHDPDRRLHRPRHRAEVAQVDERGLLELQHVLQGVGVDVAVYVAVGEGPHGVTAALELPRLGPNSFWPPTRWTPPAATREQRPQAGAGASRKVSSSGVCPIRDDRPRRSCCIRPAQAAAATYEPDRDSRHR